MAFHCFFEQSGTFKNEFKKLGYEAYDYDILNDFGETDYVIDLFKEIEDAYTHTHTTVFDRIQDGDQIIAFFPCVRFTDRIFMKMNGTDWSLRKWTDMEKLEYGMKLNNETNHMYQLITKLAIVCIKNNIPLIIENPFSQSHYLHQFWSLKPKVVDKNRRDRGDAYEKPTQYWFVNREPSNNLVFDAVAQYPKKIVAEQRTVERSMITKEYANRFIREFVI